MPASVQAISAGGVTFSAPADIDNTAPSASSAPPNPASNTIIGASDPASAPLVRSARKIRSAASAHRKGSSVASRFASPAATTSSASSADANKPPKPRTFGGTAKASASSASPPPPSVSSTKPQLAASPTSVSVN